jgi:hypothetical protein
MPCTRVLNLDADPQSEKYLAGVLTSNKNQSFSRLLIMPADKDYEPWNIVNKLEHVVNLSAIVIECNIP